MGEGGEEEADEGDAGDVGGGQGEQAEEQLHCTSHYWIYLFLCPVLYLIFVADTADIVLGEVFVMWTNFRFGDILDVERF